MTRSELIDALASRLPTYKRDDIGDMVSTVLDAITDTLAAGDRVEIRGFGSFSTHIRPWRMGRNPASGEEVSVPAKRVVRFKPGTELRERVLAAGQRPPPPPGELHDLEEILAEYEAELEAKRTQAALAAM